MLAIGIPSMSAQSSQRRKIRHVEHYQTGSQSFRNEKLPAKVKRKSSDKGNIVLIFDEQIPDSVKIALEVAKDMWEAKLQNKYPIYISVSYSPLDDDIAVITDVIYFENGDYAGSPTSLYTQLTGIKEGSMEVPDGYILFNSNIEWNCRYDSNISNEYNISTMAVRAFARCLGFGSSIFEDDKDIFIYSSVYPSFFDKLLYSNQEKLADLEQGEPEMANFVKSNDVYIDTKNNIYKVYAPANFIQDKSLCFLEDDGSIMSANLGTGNIALSIDNSTIDILRTMGWELPVTGTKIICDNISEDGIGSAYTSHKFSLGNSQSVSSYSWKFYLKNKSGEFELIQSGSSSTFLINAVSDTAGKYINIDGDLEGKIECNFVQNGVKQTAIPFYVSLELKPTIVSIKNLQRHEYDLYNFYLTFDVVYSGAESLSVEVEEEYNTATTVRRFNQPYIAHVNTGNLSSMSMTWVTIVATNKYGTTYETYEYEPTYGSWTGGSNLIVTGIEEKLIDHAPSKIELYSLNGNLIFSGDETSLNKIYLIPGIYIKKEKNRNGSTEIKKIIIP